MSNRLLAALAVSVALALASCGAPSTPDFVKKAAMSDIYEVEAGKIAGEKGQSEAVKQFGQHMVEAHTKTSEELKSIVTAEKLEVKVPDKLDKKYRRLIDALNEANSRGVRQDLCRAAGQGPRQSCRPVRRLCRGRRQRRA